MTRRRAAPPSARVLGQWVDTYARERGLTVKRVRDWIAYMILAGQLECACVGIGGPRFTIKGAVAIEMRLRAKGRATKDLDLVVDGGEEPDPVSALREALADTYQGFAFRVKGAPHLMPNEAVRVEVAIEYRGRGWGTIQVDLSAGEGGKTEVELVDALDLAPFGLETPGPLPCLSLRYHIAQKIHAMTEPAFDDDTPNERFRDLVDVMFMKELAGDLVRVRAACEDVFNRRGTHDWPPVLDPPELWREPFAALAGEIELSTDSFEAAVREGQQFIDAISRA